MDLLSSSKLIILIILLLWSKVEYLCPLVEFPWLCWPFVSLLYFLESGFRRPFSSHDSSLHLLMLRFPEYFATMVFDPQIAWLGGREQCGNLWINMFCRRSGRGPSRTRTEWLLFQCPSTSSTAALLWCSLFQVRLAVEFSMGIHRDSAECVVWLYF